MIISILQLLLAFPGESQALDCYNCYSKNGSDRRCDDPMIRMYKGVLNPEPCILPTPLVDANTTEVKVENIDLATGVNGSSNVGPRYQIITENEPPITLARTELYCVKIIGTTTESRENLVIRTCIDRDMNSQCGLFVFKGDRVRGCMLTCQEDLCNGGLRKEVETRLLIFVFILIVATIKA